MQKKYPNRIVINAKSPANEKENIKIYKSLNPAANNSDNYDVSAV